ncbi:MAG: penicillin-binding protein [Planctomycetaceae bacterium]
MCSCWAVLALRLVYLQQETQEEFSKRAERQQVYVDSIPARPGEILDRHGRVLATSVAVQSLWVNPRQIKNPRKFAGQLGPVLGIEPNAFLAELVEKKTRKFLWVRRRLDAETVKNVEALNLPPKTMGFRSEFIRQYPQGQLAAHVLGLRGIDGRGRGGVEQAFDLVLRGRAGQRSLVRDSRGKVVEVRSSKSTRPQHGKTVTLTLDIMLQLIAERELDELVDQWKPKAAGVIVVEPKSGEILAMASRPTFDPNRPVNVPDQAWKNIHIASCYEPGSTFKPMMVAAALDRGLIRKDETFHCGWGKYRMGPRLLHDHHAYGLLSLKDVLVKSSNIGMAKIGERLTNAGLYQAAIQFGFGRLTGSGLPGEIPGLLRPLPDWTIYSTGSIPMGQELSVTPLQLIMAHAALANGGRLISPQFVRSVGESNSTTVTPSLGRRVTSRVASRETAEWLVRDAMTDVVKRGTGKKARLREFSVFGKTGTAQIIDPKTGRYSEKQHVCSFVGGAPAENPRILVLVIVDSPSVGTVHYGGTVAAPTAAEVIRRCLNHLQELPRERIARKKG